ncbi:hypothetical protein PIB30_085687 [Stylosanthes scabra]|uniref:Uncharacterized protein n=1 Tax=Stylosanthes scabra TaxID=79078 RepID=A0ABU6YRQ0_9FABA|nr:hypothetical protein [Stylosanthes scabra]
MHNCYKFTLATNDNGQRLITAVDLGKVKKVFKVKAIFKLELRYINWGVFYGTMWNKYFREVLGRKVDSLFVPNVISLSVMKSIRSQLHLAYLNDSLLQQSATSSTAKSSTENEDMFPEDVNKNPLKVQVRRVGLQESQLPGKVLGPSHLLQSDEAGSSFKKYRKKDQVPTFVEGQNDFN